MELKGVYQKLINIRQFKRVFFLPVARGVEVITLSIRGSNEPKQQASLKYCEIELGLGFPRGLERRSSLDLQNPLKETLEWCFELVKIERRQGFKAV